MIDKKYDLLKHPNLSLTEDGGAAPYIHSPVCLYSQDDLSFPFTSLEDVDILFELEEFL